ncbi:MAG: HEAT repeat domain-containing protein [Phycisphaerales bacterium]|nr:HEAT repeat domain-containing protein [Phycisphaerales bacterium]
MLHRLGITMPHCPGFTMLHRLTVLMLAGAGCAGALGGCAATPGPSGSPWTLRQRAMDALKRGVAYRGNPAVRVGAVEALQEGAAEEGLAWVRLALLDSHAGVRFAGCVALGKLQDAGSTDALRRRLEDADASVRAAAIFALHRLGHTQRSGELGDLLLANGDPLVRCNAAMLLGRLGEPSAAPLLARAMRDKDPRVQDQALEAMGLLDLPEARTQLGFLANSGIGSQEAFAVAALGEAARPAHLELLRAKLTSAQHMETRLAAARGLGLLGERDGLELAIAALRFDRPRRGEPEDDPQAQIIRVRLMAVRALAAIGDERALQPLERVMSGSGDPRLQVAAAGALLRILRHPPPASPGSSASPARPASLPPPTHARTEP